MRKYVAGGALAGLALVGGAIGATTLGTANAATGSAAVTSAAAATASTATAATPTATTTAAADPHPGDNGADGVAESNEVHRGGHGLDLSGTITAINGAAVTIKNAAGVSKTYTVASASDVDKSGEASVSSLAVGDAVTFSVDSTNVTQIDKIHAGDMTKDMPAPAASSSATTAG